MAMSNRRGTVVLAALLGSVVATHVMSCGNTYDEFVAPLLDPKSATWDAGPDAEGGLPPECNGDPSTKNVIDECGIFVKAGAAAGGDGNKATPFAKLADAIGEAQATGKRVYACAPTTGSFSESVTISAGIEVFGGFDCANWAWSKDARTALNGLADTVALTIEKSATGAKVAGFMVTAASPSDMKGGGSSIAVAVDDVEATLERCNVEASNAADGVDGEMPTGMGTKGADAAAPTDTTGATAACLPAGGGTPGTTTCDDGMTSGGTGGKGGVMGANNGDGEKGANGEPADGVNGFGGAGESATKCAAGAIGQDGDSGVAGPGGSANGDALSLSGVTNADATSGKPGTRGQGGGGGGGAKAGTFCQAGAQVVDGNGASGGGGGAGGCGGKGGGGGRAGGSSIAIVSLGTKLVLTDVTLAVGTPGKGGKGVIGQGGASGGHGADGGVASGLSGSKAGCKGGDGGAGGDGGPGGGGRGGHAVGIAYAKTPSAAPSIKTFTGGSAGGTGGDAGSAGGNAGEQGKAGQCWDFAGSKACGS
jgi:hypothetical protein